MQTQDINHYDPEKTGICNFCGRRVKNYNLGGVDHKNSGEYHDQAKVGYAKICRECLNKYKDMVKNAKTN